MKKRLISVMLSLTLVTACAQKAQDTQDAPPPEVTTTAEAETTTTTESTTATKSETVSATVSATEVTTETTASETAATTTASAIAKPVVESREFAPAAADFTVDVFKRAYAEGKGKNAMTSPLSVMLALSMTANGANGETLAEIERMFGMDLNALNERTSAFIGNLPSSNGAKLNVANSIWYRDGLNVLDAFLGVNKKYYKAEIRKSAFDSKTAADINGWVKKKTDGMIEKVISEIPAETVMYLINAIAFDGKWEEEYKDAQVRDADFTAYGGAKQTANMMYGDEDIYISDKNATGFIKPYKDGNYSFAALLPNKGVNIDDYVAGLNGENLLNTLDNKSYEQVYTGIPKFKCEYDVILNTLLGDMGMNLAFDPDAADFSKLGTSPNGNIYISNVLHKTFIEVDEKGTKAAAVTVVADNGGSMPLEPKTVILDRPFVYAIIDNATNLPVFIGVLTEIPN